MKNYYTTIQGCFLSFKSKEEAENLIQKISIQFNKEKDTWLIRMIISQTEGTITKDYINDLLSFNRTQLELILNYAKSNKLFC
jgi:hypothetical protein